MKMSSIATRFLLSLYFTTTLCSTKLCQQSQAAYDDDNRKVPPPPNIVFILTDDQDSVMGGLEPMTKTQQLLSKAGTTFSNSFVASPLCCPSRSSILTGRYVHNHGAVNNSLSGGCSSRRWQKTGETKAFPVYLKQLGYQTFFAGKYLNQYGRKHEGGVGHVPPGWDDWHGLVGNSRYYNYTLSENGEAEVHGDNYSTDYLTDVIGRKAASFLATKSTKTGPFFMMLSTPACHAPFTPAPQYAKHFHSQTAPRSPSFGYYGKDKHWLLRAVQNPMSNVSLKYIDTTFRNRWRTLLSVDDIVEKVVTTLTEKKLLNNTYIVFTSDNGFHLGQFSLPNDKRQMYEFDIRVPFIIHGPGIAAGKVLQEAVLNIDLAPTFIDLAGGSTPPGMDGRSLVPLLLPSCKKHPLGVRRAHANHREERWRGSFLVEHQGEHKVHVPGCPQYSHMGLANCFPECVCEDAANNTYTCLRLLDPETNAVFCQFSDRENFTEVYDMRSDPHQLVNLTPVMSASVRAALSARLQRLRVCVGESCRKDVKLEHGLRRGLRGLHRKAWRSAGLSLNAAQYDSDVFRLYKG